MTDIPPPAFSRRGLLLGLAASALLLRSSTIRPAAAMTIEFKGKTERLPNFDLASIKRLAGLRPHRDGGYRLSAETFGKKTVFHNYGHSGGGISMSWGCAQEICDLVVKSDLLKTERSVAVIGAGVMGLTAATALLQLKPQVKIRIFADAFYADTTSHVAGGQWLPTSVQHSDEDQYRRILNRAFQSHASRIGKGFGVSRRINYSVKKLEKFDFVDKRLVPEPVVYDRLPFKSVGASGYAYQTLLVEPPIFLKRLHADLAASKRVQFVKRNFGSSDDILTLPETIIVNCTGLGAGKLWKDPKVKAAKGQLVVLPPQPLKYLFSGEACGQWDQYMFPRSDGLIIGGTYQELFDSPDSNLQTCNELLARIKGFFNGSQKCEATPKPV